ncbi:hypothetical protein A3K63_02795 [Candidatus Micrarchaeota archaeon RBG_16_49_10]|nr:MAG: hypothetical protein A3K63_02795 [Candidatus Micrarchaeota archaeon RBG_16_49_10]
MPNLKEKYKKLMSKHSLPKLEDLEREFSFELEEDGDILSFISDKILERMDEFSKTLETALFPVHDPSKLYEAKMAKGKREELFGIYKSMMSLYWEGRKTLIAPTEKTRAEYIKKAYGMWVKDFKEKVMSLFDLFEKEWQKVQFENNNDTALYFG